MNFQRVQLDKEFQNIVPSAEEHISSLPTKFIFFLLADKDREW